MEKVKKVVRVVNNAYTVYVGFTTFMIGICSVVGIFVLAYKGIFTEREFSWGLFVLLAILGALFIPFGFALMQSGEKELHKE